MGVLTEQTGYIEKSIKSLDEILSSRRVAEIMEDFILSSGILYILQSSTQSLIDMAYRVLSELGEKPPNSYGEASHRLVELGILAPEDGEKMKSMIGFRNVLVHRYLELSRELVVEILTERRYRDILAIAYKILKKSIDLGIDP